MTDAELQERIAHSPALQELQDQLAREVRFKTDDSVQFDPILIVTVISIIVQIVIHCRENNKEETVRRDMRDLRALPVWRTAVLRRRLRQLWRDRCPNARDVSGNALIDAVYQLSDSADDSAIDEILWLARANHPAE